MFEYGVACSLEKDVPALWPIPLRGPVEYLAETAREIGYTGIELQLRDPERYNWHSLADAAAKMDVVYTAIATGRENVENGHLLISEDPAVRRAAIEKLKLHIDLGQALNCMVVVGTVRGNVPDFARYSLFEGYLIEAMHELSEYALRKGVSLVVENITANISNWLNTIKQVKDFIDKLSLPNVGVHLDTYSMLMEDADIGGAVNYCGDALRYVHYSDSGRMYPGGGNVNFKSFTRALYRSKYKGYVVVESRPYPNEYICAKRGYEYMKAIETCVAIEEAEDTLKR